RLFVDEDASGANRARPALTKALRYLRPGDTLIVWKLDRLARSLQDLLDIAGDLQGRGIAFESLTEKLDTSTAHGEFAFHMIAAVAQMERRLIAERTVAGLDAARRRGVRLGRRPKLDEQDVREAHRLLAGGMAGIADIAARHSVAEITLARAFVRYGLEG
ncbi:MAG: recombinase family protein, partial [Chromatocurvus sp.]